MGSSSSIVAGVCRRLLVVGLAWFVGGASAAAAPDAASLPDIQPVVTPAPAPLTRFLPTTSSAAIGDAPVVTGAWGGYDGAARAPVAALAAEVRIVGPVAMLVGAAYAESADVTPALRLKVGLRAQLLAQARAGVDASAMLLYRQDQFTNEDGFVQAGIAVGRTFGSVQAVANAFYGQDGEGDDRVGELRAAAFRELGRGFHVGGEGRYARSLASTDPMRLAHGTPSMQAMAGPMLAYTAGRWVLVVEGGAATQRTLAQQTGFVGVAGVGTTF